MPTNNSSSLGHLPSTLGPFVLALDRLPAWPVLVPLLLVTLPVLAVVCNVSYQIFWPKDPTLPPVVFHYLPWIGSAVQYGMDPYKFYFECREKHGDLFTFILIGRKVTVALGPKGNNLILGGKLSQVSAKEAYTHFTTPVFGKGVVYDCPNSMLMEQKRFVKVGLSLDNLRAYIPMIVDEFNGMLASDAHFAPSFAGTRKAPTSRWRTFPALKTLSGLTILTASRTLQGKEVRAALDTSFARKLEDLDRGFTPLNFLFPNLPLPSYWRRDKAQRELSDFYLGIMESRRNGESDHDHDMIASLQAQTYKDGRSLTNREIASMMIALLMGGQHTSSATSTWALLELASKLDVYQSLFDEQVCVLGDGEGGFRMLEYDDLKMLPTMDSVIRETLRVHSPLHSIFRKVIGDIPVQPTVAAPSESGAYVIPTGHFVLASPGVAQTDARIWGDAGKWDPTRWTEQGGVAAKAGQQYENSEGDKVDYGFGAISKGTESPYQPFGAGRHRCIGEAFAYVQLSTILSCFVQKMELKLEGGVPETDYTSMVVLPKPPHDIMFRPRA